MNSYSDVILAYFCTLGYCMSRIELVESLCRSFKWRGHMLSTQSIISTWETTREEKNMLTGRKENNLKVNLGYSACQHVLTVTGRLTKFSSLVWLNSKLMTLYSFSLWEGGVSKYRLHWAIDISVPFWVATSITSIIRRLPTKDRI